MSSAMVTTRLGGILLLFISAADFINSNYVITEKVTITLVGFVIMGAITELYNELKEVIEKEK